MIHDIMIFVQNIFFVRVLGDNKTTWVRFAFSYYCIKMTCLKVEDMTPTEADHLLAERLMERRNRTGSVLSDEQEPVIKNFY